MLDLVQTEFGEGRLAEENIWQAVVLIPNGKRDYHGIGLMGVMWKVMAAILNCQLTASITFHDLLHRFLGGCGTGTTTLEAKLLQKLADSRKEVLYVIFMDLHKAYDALNRSRFLEILEGYSVGHRAFRLFQIYWSRLSMVAKAGGYYRDNFTGAWGVTQGDLISPFSKWWWMR